MKLPKFLFQHPVEVILIISSSVITATSFLLYSFNDTNKSLSPDVLAVDDEVKKVDDTSKIFHIDVSGAVLNPDLYEVTPGARLKDVIDLAGGLSEDADRFFVGRNFNMAKVLNDQEKIYIPYLSDIANGTFVEEARVLNYLEKPAETESTESNNNIQISINSSSVEELDTLSGVGPVTAQKIIDSRPYSTIDELLSKKVVSNSTFEKIKEFISL